MKRKWGVTVIGNRVDWLERRDWRRGSQVLVPDTLRNGLHRAQLQFSERTREKNLSERTRTRWRRWRWCWFGHILLLCDAVSFVFGPNLHESMIWPIGYKLGSTNDPLVWKDMFFFPDNQGTLLPLWWQILICLAKFLVYVIWVKF